MSSDGARGETTIEEPTAAERTIARRAAESRATVPGLELSVAVAPGPGTGTAELVRACALALLEHPRANAAYRDGRFELYSRINVGVVIATDERYAIPTVFDAESKSLPELKEEIDGLAAGAAAGTLPAPAFTAATFSLWNAAQAGIGAASIPVVAPQAAALAAGTQALTLVCDHRVLYGARAARFLNDVKARLAPAGP